MLASYWCPPRSSETSIILIPYLKREINIFVISLIFYWHICNESTHDLKIMHNMCRLLHDFCHLTTPFVTVMSRGSGSPDLEDWILEFGTISVNILLAAKLFRHPWIDLILLSRIYIIKLRFLFEHYNTWTTLMLSN